MKTPIVGKSESLLDNLMQKIATGEHAGGDLLPPERVMAERHNVSRTTVRNALRRLEEDGLICRRKGAGTYVATDAAERLSEMESTKTLRLGVVIPPRQRENEMVLSMIRALSRYIGPHTSIRLFSHSFLKFDAYAQQDVDLLLIDGSGFGNPIRLDPAYASRTILLNCHAEEGNYLCPDDYAGGQIMARTAIEAGHRRIGLLHYGNGTDGFARRLAGIRDTLREHGLEPAGESETPLYDFQTIPPALATQQLLRVAPGMTAVICICDYLAMVAYDVFEELGRSVPDDISVIGFDDVLLGRFLSPPLTTVRLPVDEIAEAVAEAVVRYRTTGRLELRSDILPVLVMRNSICTIDEDRRT